MTKQSLSRKNFLGLAGAGIAGAAGVPFLGGASTALAQGTSLRPQDADLVVFNAKVYTVDPRACRRPRRSR